MQKDQYKHEIDPTASITEQASAWWMLLNHGDATPADHRAFKEWVVRSPERVEAFLQTARLTHALKSQRLKWPDTPVEILIREAKAAAAEIIDLPTARRSSQAKNRSWFFTRQTGPRLGLLSGMAASALVLIATASVWLASISDHYQTAIGEQRSIVLGDSSVVMLNTSSAIEVRMTKNHRTVKLLSGEALFQVAHDATRPFDVTVDNATVRAVGTQFNVDQRESGTTVTVVEGKVAVFTGDEGKPGETARLSVAAGEQVAVTRHQSLKLVHANVATVTAWTQRRLIFEHRSLGEVAEEFNRYNRERIEIQSPQLREEKITGTFDANNPESFMTFLGKIPGVTVERSVDERRLIVTQTASGGRNL